MSLFPTVTLLHPNKRLKAKGFNESLLAKNNSSKPGFQGTVIQAYTVSQETGRFLHRKLSDPLEMCICGFSREMPGPCLITLDNKAFWLTSPVPADSFQSVFQHFIL